MVMAMKSALFAEMECGMDGMRILIVNTTGIQMKRRRATEKMKIIAVLDIDEKKLGETGCSFEDEMGWTVKSGIYLKEYQESSMCSEYEYAAFVWDTDTRKYVQVTKPVATGLLCKNRYEERLREGQVLPSYDTDSVVFRKRLVSTVLGGWEDIADGG